MPTLSIITINLNNHKGLLKTINSVISQTYTDYEWIVIDGGSTDKSQELLEHHADRFAVCVSETDSGIYNAMNKGLSQAKGTWVQFLNSGDSLYQSNTLEEVFNINHNNVDILYGDVCIETEKGCHIHHYPNEPSMSYFFKETINHQCTFYRRSLFNDYRYNEQYTIVADWVALIQFLLKGAKFSYINLPISRFDMNGISNKQYQKRKMERERYLSLEFPSLVKLDIDKLMYYYDIQNRLYSHRTTSLLTKLTYVLLLKLESLSSKK